MVEFGGDKWNTLVGLEVFFNVEERDEIWVGGELQSFVAVWSDFVGVEEEVLTGLVVLFPDRVHVSIPGWVEAVAVSVEILQ